MTQEWCDPNDLAADDPERENHLARYRFACRHIARGAHVANAACGANYGSPMLYDAGAAVVVGFDVGEAQKDHSESRGYGVVVRCDIERRTFSGTMATGDFGGRLFVAFDTLVTIETLEHLREPREWLLRLSPDIRTLILSTPIVPTMHLNPFHLHDFTEEQVLGWIREAGFTVDVIEHMNDGWYAGGREPVYLLVKATR